MGHSVQQEVKLAINAQRLTTTLEYVAQIPISHLTEDNNSLAEGANIKTVGMYVAGAIRIAAKTSEARYSKAAGLGMQNRATP